MDGTNERNERALRAYTGLIRAADSVTGLLEMQLAPMRLTLSQGRVLEALAKFGPMSHLSLARRILRSKSAVALMLKELERRRLVSSRTDKRDRRKQTARVTLAGNKLAAELVPVHTKLIRAQMAALGRREQETLARLCEKLIAGDSRRFAEEFVRSEA
jgi:MarR family transcriptional regulator, 2-MHQ and catechol-resistance regulon repressor